MNNLEDPGLIEVWNDFIKRVAALEVEIVKSARGNLSAGIRARHELVRIRNSINDMKKRMIDTDKERVIKRREMRKMKK